MPGRTFTTSVTLPGRAQPPFEFGRADILFSGVDQSGPSYEVRVFVNNPSADERTDSTAENGYAGSFHVYGYGLWPDEPLGPEDEAGEMPRPARVRRYLVATEAVRRAVAERGRTITVTAVAVPYGGAPDALDVDLNFDDVSIRLDGRPRS